MALELWILLALAVVAMIFAAVVRLRRKRRAAPAETAGNIYPLW